MNFVYCRPLSSVLCQCMCVQEGMLKLYLLVSTKMKYIQLTTTFLRRILKRGDKSIMSFCCLVSLHVCPGQNFGALIACKHNAKMKCSQLIKKSQWEYWRNTNKSLLGFQCVCVSPRKHVWTLIAYKHNDEIKYSQLTTKGCWTL